MKAKTRYVKPNLERLGSVSALTTGGSASMMEFSMAGVLINPMSMS